MLQLSTIALYSYWHGFAKTDPIPTRSRPFDRENSWLFNALFDCPQCHLVSEKMMQPISAICQRAMVRKVNCRKSWNPGRQAFLRRTINHFVHCDGVCELTRVHISPIWCGHVSPATKLSLITGNRRVPWVLWPVIHILALSLPRFQDFWQFNLRTTFFTLLVTNQKTRKHQISFHSNG